MPAHDTHPWRRLWRSLEHPVPTDEDGFGLTQHLGDVSGARARALDEIDASCAVLLGESGAGKSVAVLNEVRRLRAAGAVVHRFDLSGRRDESKLRDDLRQVLGESTDRTVHLFFDSLDEAGRELARFDALLAEELERHYRIVPQVRLRIACRTGALPPTLVESLGAIWGAGKVSRWEITPLTKADALAAMNARGLKDVEGTLARWCEAGLGPLATRPVTLELLLDVARDPSETLTAMGVTELYGRALNQMLRRVDATSHRAALRRLAAVTLLGDRSHVRPHDRGAFRDAWTLDELARGSEPGDGGRTVTIDRALLEAVCEGPLFGAPIDGGDGSVVTWRHRSFAEFLCAEWLLKHHPGAAALAWVERTVAGERRVVPQLEGVATTMASMRGEVLEALVARAPHLLPEVDPAALDAVQRARVVDAFLRDADEGRAPAWWHLRGTHLAAFEHPGLDEQLRPWITDTSRSTAARMAVLWTVERARRESMVPALLDAASNAGDTTVVRKEAVAAVVAILPARDARLKHLLPLLEERVPDDHGETIRGLVLRACWPWCFADAAKAFAALVPPRDDRAYGTYRYFLDHDLFRLMPESWLPEALAWARVAFTRPERWIRKDFRAEIVRLAWERVGEPEVLDGLVSLRVAALHDHEDLTMPDALRAPEHSATRVTLAERTLQASAGSERRWSIDASACAWLAPQDFHGLVARAVVTVDPELGERLLELALQLHRSAEYPLAQSEALWELREREPRFEKQLDRLWSAWGVDDPEVQWMRRKARPAPPARPPKDVASAMQHRQILSQLDRAEREDPERWWHVHAWMCAIPVTEEKCELTHDFRVDGTPFWKAADETLRTRMFDAALRYVERCDPHVEEWFGKNVWHRPALAGRAALALLQQFAPDRLARLTAERWALWTPAILDPTWVSDQQHGGLWPSLLRESHRHVPAVVRDRVMALLEVENARNEHAFVLGALEAVQDTLLTNALLERLRLGALRPNIFRDALGVAGRVLKDETARFCVGFIGDCWQAGDPDAACAVFAAGWLLRSVPETAWTTLDAPFHALPSLGGKTVEAAADWPAVQWSPAMTAPDHLAGYYRWAKRYLAELDPETRDHLWQGGVVTASHHVDDSIAPTVRRLRELGTESAVAALHALHLEDPGNEFLRGEWFFAQQVAAERAWRPWSLDELLGHGLPRDLRRKIRDALAAHYRSAANAMIVSGDSGLSAERIDWTGSAQVIWDRVVECAAVAGRLEALLVRCSEDYHALTPLLAELRAPRRRDRFAP